MTQPTYQRLLHSTCRTSENTNTSSCTILLYNAMMKLIHTPYMYINHTRPSVIIMTQTLNIRFLLRLFPLSEPTWFLCWLLTHHDSQKFTSTSDTHNHQMQSDWSTLLYLGRPRYLRQILLSLVIDNYYLIFPFISLVSSLSYSDYVCIVVVFHFTVIWLFLPVIELQFSRMSPQHCL